MTRRRLATGPGACISRRGRSSHEPPDVHPEERVAEPEAGVVDGAQRGDQLCAAGDAADAPAGADGAAGVGGGLAADHRPEQGLAGPAAAGEAVAAGAFVSAFASTLIWAFESPLAASSAFFFASASLAALAALAAGVSGVG